MVTDDSSAATVVELDSEFAELGCSAEVADDAECVRLVGWERRCSGLLAAIAHQHIVSYAPIANGLLFRDHRRRYITTTSLGCHRSTENIDVLDTTSPPSNTIHVINVFVVVDDTGARATIDVHHATTISTIAGTESGPGPESIGSASMSRM